MREQSRDPRIIEWSNLKDAEFKILVIKIFNELRGSVDKVIENFNKEIKTENIKTKLEIIKGTSQNEEHIIWMRSILGEINRVDKEEDWTTDIEDEEAKGT